MTKRLNTSDFIREPINEALAAPPPPPTAQQLQPAAQVRQQAARPKIQQDGSLTVSAGTADMALFQAVDTIAHEKCTYTRSAVIETVKILKSKSIVKQTGSTFTVTLNGNQVNAIAEVMQSAYNQAISGK